MRRRTPVGVGTGRKLGRACLPLDGDGKVVVEIGEGRRPGTAVQDSWAPSQAEQEQCLCLG